MHNFQNHSAFPAAAGVPPQLVAAAATAPYSEAGSPSPTTTTSPSSSSPSACTNIFEAQLGANKRTPKACDRCRFKKTKCTGTAPCQRCIIDNTVCTYALRRPKYGPNTHPQQAAHDAALSMLLKCIQIMNSELLRARLGPYEDVETAARAESEEFVVGVVLDRFGIECVESGFDGRQIYLPGQKQEQYADEGEQFVQEHCCGGNGYELAIPVADIIEQQQSEKSNQTKSRKKTHRRRVIPESCYTHGEGAEEYEHGFEDGTGPCSISSEAAQGCLQMDMESISIDASVDNHYNSLTTTDAIPAAPPNYGNINNGNAYLQYLQHQAPVSTLPPPPLVHQLGCQWRRQQQEAWGIAAPTFTAQQQEHHANLHKDATYINHPCHQEERSDPDFTLIRS